MTGSMLASFTSQMSLNKESVFSFKGRGGGVSRAISRLGKVLEVPADRWEAK